MPLHVSAGSHTGLAPAARHSVLAALKRSAQSPAPSQVSAASQPAVLLEPHATVEAANASAGQVALLPLQVSEGSQVGLAPAARQTEEAALSRATHTPAPSQVSGALQALLSGEPQTVVIGGITFAGQTLVVPLHSSAGSQDESAPGVRHTLAAAFTRSTQLPFPSQVSASLHAVVSEDPQAAPDAAVG